MKNVIRGKTLGGVLGFQYLCKKCFSCLEGVEKYCWNCGVELNFDFRVKGKVVEAKDD
jgi:predicted amidophosphoribosyltransferase